MLSHLQLNFKKMCFLGSVGESCIISHGVEDCGLIVEEITRRIKLYHTTSIQHHDAVNITIIIIHGSGSNSRGTLYYNYEHAQNTHTSMHFHHNTLNCSTAICNVLAS